MIELLMKLGPWIGMAIAAASAIIAHSRSSAKVSDAKQQAQIDVAAAQARQRVAEDNLSAGKRADVQADADPAKTAASAAQERTNVENSQTHLDDAAARDELIRMLHGSGEDNSGSGQGP